MRPVVIQVGCALAACFVALPSPAARRKARRRLAQRRSARRPQAGLRDAGEAARNMELVANLPKPEGFFDPKAPAGEPTPPGAAIPNELPDVERRRIRRPPNAGRAALAAARLSFANSDLAFSGNLLFVGNFNGFNTYDIENPKKPRLVASVVCPGGQGDVSVHGNLLFMSVEQTRGRIDCGTQGVDGDGQRRALPRRPHLRHQRLAASRSRSPRCRPAADRTRTRSSSIRRTRPTSTSTDRAPARCARPRSWRAARDSIPKEDPNTALFSIDVIQVPLAAPEKARIVNRPRIFADPGDRRDRRARGRAAITGRARRRRRATNQCHDITVFPEIGLAAGACSGNGILLDISDPVNPVRLDDVVRQELRVLALGDVQQRRHEGDLHRRVGRRHAAALPRDRSARRGAPTRSSTSSIASSRSAATTRCRRRRPSRRTASRTTDR